jgi:plastocyanin
MTRKLIALAAGLAVTAALTTTALAGHASTPMLVGTDGPGYTITLKTAAGKAVTSLKAGSYKLVIHDKSSIHGWSLDGPHGFAKDIAAISAVGTKTVTLNLKAGKYKFYCPNHESVMFGHFTVK